MKMIWITVNNQPINTVIQKIGNIADIPNTEVVISIDTNIQSKRYEELSNDRQDKRFTKENFNTVFEWNH